MYWVRYIDGVFGYFIDIGLINYFEKQINECHPTIKFDLKYDKVSRDAFDGLAVRNIIRQWT